MKRKPINLYANSIYLIIAIVLFFSLISKEVYADQYFDSYGNISWDQEVSRLSNFAIFLARNTEMVGYIGYYVGNKEKPEDVKRRVDRGKRYIECEFGINETRIVILSLGKKEETKIILQPVQKDKPPPF